MTAEDQTACAQCSQLLPAGAAHCPFCGAKQLPVAATQPSLVPSPVTMAEMAEAATQISPQAPLQDALPTEVEPDAATRLATAPVDAMPTIEGQPAAPTPATPGAQSPKKNPALTESGPTRDGRPRSGTRDLEAVEPERERFPPGELLFSHYRSVARLGEGGMGSVYLARDDLSGQEVAVKVLPATLAKEPDIRERFVQEARALAQLDHPAIVPLVTFAREGNDHFLVMKYVAGQSLEDIIEARGPLPISTCRNVFRTIVEALGYAHGLRVVHRDVKPANVLLTEDERIFLVDFGIAKRDKSARLTQTGMLMGTPQYMSPEQISGHEIDGRSDLYAAGLLLFEMLTGRPPFLGEKTFTILKQHVEAPVPDPRTLRDEDIPKDLLHACEALLRKNPDDRPADAVEVIKLLDGEIPNVTPVFGTADADAEAGARGPTPHTGGVDAQVFEFEEDVDDHALLHAQRSGTRVALLMMGVAVLGIAAALYFVPELMKQPPPPPPPPPVDQPKPEEHAFEMLLGQAAKHLSEGKPRKALPLLETALAQQPDNPRALLFEAQALLRLKKRKRAEKLVEKLEARDDLPPELKGVLESVREVIEIESGRKKREKKK
jgi:serine/threonine protein kinase